MKKLFKKPMRKALGLSVALALGSVAMVQAAPTLDNLGDMAIVPYYTVNGNFTSGLHITNTTGKTQAVKVRYHRGDDSADALDFIVLLSPYDAFTGYVNNKRSDGSEGLTFRASDNSCTVSGAATGDPISPRSNVTGGTEGYITVIGMGELADYDEDNDDGDNDLTTGVELGSGERQLLALDVKHDSNGNPRNCERAARNFFAMRGDGTGVVNSDETAIRIIDDPLLLTSTRYAAFWNETPDNALRVSYFLRDKTKGLELGNTAEHFDGFSDQAMMANQEFGIADLNMQPGVTEAMVMTGYDFPNLEGGSSNGGFATPNSQARFDAVRDGYQADAIINDWSVLTASGVSTSTIATDWVITFPGQNLMLNKDIPVSFDPVAWNREEGQPTSGGLAVSPDGLLADHWTLDREVNILTWSNKPSRDAGGAPSVLSSGSAHEVKLDGGNDANNVNYQNAYDSGNGWATVYFRDHVSQNSSPVGNNIYDLSDPLKPTRTVGTDWAGTATGVNVTGIPVVGFTAWNRVFADGNNYARAATHSYVRPQ